MSRIPATAVYRAERHLELAIDMRDEFPTAQVFGSTVNVPMQLHFGQIDHVAKYVQYVLAAPKVRQAYPDRALLPLAVRVRKGPNKAHYDSSNMTIALPDNRFGLSELTVLHEIAHFLDNTGTHDLSFIKALDTLIDAVMAPEALLIYREAMMTLVGGTSA